ncbi:MAG: DUF692 domain-containing protein [Sedimenticola sp.]|nr:DUF692 domain-containing protein [Sedimenticola sp.]
MNQNAVLPNLGFGLRLRADYLPSFIGSEPELDWLEIITENYLGANEETLDQLDKIRSNYPIVMHGISLAIGSPWPLDQAYLNQLKKLVDRVNPAWISDHLCWKGADDVQGQLLPLPYSEDTLEHVVTRINQVQEFLGRQILLENVPIEQKSNQEMPEVEFIRQVADRSDSLILIDVGNLLASSLSQEFSAIDYINQIPAGRVQQVHLPDITFETSSDGNCDASPQIIDPIWQIYTEVLDRFGLITTMIEREDTIPTLKGMLCDIKKIRKAALSHMENG